jgi:hypothetical protein
MVNNNDGIIRGRSRSPEQGRIIAAEFIPDRMDDVHPLALPLYGRRVNWICQGPVEGMDYVGQEAWVPVGAPDFPGWVPTQDLKNIEALSL